jgi:hypothetical protein
MDEVDVFFEENVKTNIYSDIECMIHHGLNFSIAALLAAYTEIIGAVYNENIGEEGRGRCNYETILNKMGYSNVITDFQSILHNNPYKIIRCGLLHQYVIKYKAKVHSENDNCISGILIKNDIITICNRRYFEDFKKAINEIIDEMQTNPEKKMRMNEQFRENQINLSMTSGQSQGRF